MSSIDSEPAPEGAHAGAASGGVATPIAGGCLCGAIRYRLTAPPGQAALCHCRSCRRASGAPVVAWISVPRSAFVLERGTPALFESSAGVVRGFCARCGSPLTYERRRDASIDVTTASLDEPEAFAPTREVWIGERLAWQPLCTGLAHFEGSSLED